MRALPPVEIAPRHSAWFDYESRYEHGETEFTSPPVGIDEAVLTRVGQVALDTWTTLGLRGFARVDLILDRDGTPWVLEASLVPGLTDTSLIPIACEAAGMSFTDFVAAVLRDALR